MSTAPAGAQPPTVPRRPATDDQPAAASCDTSVTSLADLVGRAATVTFCAPSDLGPCEDCMKVHAIAVATVTWPDPEERDGTSEITVCRDCLGSQIAFLDRGLDADATVEVEVPAWTADDLHATLDLPSWMSPAPVGVPLLFLRAEDGGRYLADEVDHARQLVGLHRAGMSLTLANALLRKDPDLARSVEAAARRLWGAA